MGIFYLNFAAVIVSAQPFLIEQRAEAGFLYLLPVTKWERVAGRYGFGMALSLFMTGVSMIIGGIKLNTGSIEMEIVSLGVGISFGIGILTTSLQYILFYALGKMKSQQLAGIIMMAPGFLMFFGLSYLIETLYDDFTFWLKWILTHIELIAIGFTIVGIVVWLVGMMVSYRITKNRDFF